MTRPGAKRWPTLFSPLALGSLTLPNRIVMPAMDPSLANPDGTVTQAMIDHYVQRATGGVGLIITGNVGCDPVGRVSGRMPLLSDDAHIPGFRALCDAVHTAEGLIFIQISHAGRQTLDELAGGQTVSASAISCPVMRSSPRALEDAEVEAVAQRFADAAYRAQIAGADGVEFHMAHGYLVCQFLSPYSNKRDDRWGRDSVGRVAFAELIIRRARALVGPDFPLQCRLSADERVDGGIEPPLALEYAKALVAAGADSLSISACNYESYRYNMPCYYLPKGTYVSLAHAIREGLEAGPGPSVPVIGVGRIADGDAAESILANGHADLVAIGRALIADPALPEKLLSDAEDAVRPCVACNRCAEAITKGPLRCLVNPSAGHAIEAPSAAGSPKRITVIGGGPAGVSFAVEAARRGHDVRLLEAGTRLGGKAWASGMPPAKAAYTRYAEWLERQVDVAGIVVEFDRPQSPQTVRDLEDTDLVVIAVGAQPRPSPMIPGLAEHPRVCHPEQALADQRPFQHALVLGGGPEGCEVADALKTRHPDAQVTVIELRRKVGLGLPSSVRAIFEERLLAQAIRLETRKTVTKIDADGIHIADKRGKKPLTLDPADLIVVATGVMAPVQWPDGPGILRIGDARAPATLLEAVEEGWRIGRQI